MYILDIYVFLSRLMCLFFYKYVKLMKLADLAGNKKPAQGGLKEFYEWARYKPKAKTLWRWGAAGNTQQRHGKAKGNYYSWGSAVGGFCAKWNSQVWYLVLKM